MGGQGFDGGDKVVMGDPPVLLPKTSAAPESVDQRSWYLAMVCKG